MGDNHRKPCKPPGPPVPPKPPGPQPCSKHCHQCNPCKSSEKKGLLKEFDQDVIAMADVELTTSPQLLASVTINTKRTGERVWLTGTVQTVVSPLIPPGVETGFLAVTFEIFRNDPTFTMPLISFTDVVITSGGANINTTSFNFVDMSPPTGSNTYYLTAKYISDNVTIVANVNRVVFTAAEIQPNN